MRKWFKKYVSPILPLYAIIPIVMCFVFNSVVYFGVRLIDENFKYYDFTTELDRAVPFVPWFVSIYFICYLFWVVNYILIGRFGKEHLYKFVTAELLSRVVCGICFILIPTTNIRPEVIGSDIWSQLMRFLYSYDEANNLFPSIHCLVSWFCFIGIRGKKEIPRWYRIFSCIFALLVCASTQFVKQHYLVDMIGGILLAEGIYLFAKKTSIWRKFQSIFEHINRSIWGKENIMENGKRGESGK